MIINDYNDSQSDVGDEVRRQTSVGTKRWIPAKKINKRMTLLADLQKLVYTLIADRISDQALTDKLAKCLALLIKRPSDDSSEVDLHAVRALGFRGLPEECPEIRAVFWKLTMGYLPREIEKWDEFLDSKRVEYAQLIAELCSDPGLKDALVGSLLGNTAGGSGTSGDMLLSAKSGEVEKEAVGVVEARSAAPAPSGPSSSKYEQIDLDMYDQINKDVFRTRREHTEFFSRSLDSSVVGLGAGAASSSPSAVAGSESASSSSLTMTPAPPAAPPTATAAPPASSDSAANSGSSTDQQQEQQASPLQHPGNATQMICDVCEPKNHFDAMGRILFLYSKLNPGIRYVQGMNELLAVLYFLFHSEKLTLPRHAEADTFFCFSILMAEQRDCFLKSLDHSESGMHGRIAQLNSLLRALDYQVWRKLESNAVDPTFYSLRWIMLLLSQELSLADTVRLWDSLLHDPSPSALMSGGGGRSREGRSGSAVGASSPASPAVAAVHVNPLLPQPTAVPGIFTGPEVAVTLLEPSAAGSANTLGSSSTTSDANLTAHLKNVDVAAAEGGERKDKKDAAVPEQKETVRSPGGGEEVVEFSAPAAPAGTTAPEIATTTTTTTAASSVPTFHLADDDDEDENHFSDPSNEHPDAIDQAFQAFDKKHYDQRASPVGGAYFQNNMFSTLSSKSAASSSSQGQIKSPNDYATTAAPSTGSGGSNFAYASSLAYATANTLVAASPTTGTTAASSTTSTTTLTSFNPNARSSTPQHLTSDLADTELDDLLPKVQQQPFLHYVCVAMILRVREVLLAGDFIENMKILQHYPPFYVQETIFLAVKLMKQHELRLRGMAAGKLLLNAAGSAIADVAQGSVSALENIGSGAISSIGGAVTSVVENEKVKRGVEKIGEKAGGVLGWLGGKLNKGMASIGSHATGAGVGGSGGASGGEEQPRSGTTLAASYGGRGSL